MTERKEIGALIEECIETSEKARRTRKAHEAAISRLSFETNEQIRAAIDKFNSSGNGPYLYAVDEITVNTVFQHDERKVAIAVKLGDFRHRSSGHLMMYREAWEIPEQTLTQPLKDFLREVLPWLRGCQFAVYTPEDYDPMTSDPEA